MLDLARAPQLPGYDPYRDAGDCVWRADRARAALDFFAHYIVLTEGQWAGQPFVLPDWQAAIVANLFGWYKPDGTRRFNTLFLYVPRKNGKTTLAAGITLCVMFLDQEPMAQLYAAAHDKEQAKIIFRACCAMIDRSPELSALVRVYKSFSTIEALDGQAFYRVLSGESQGKHGMSPHYYTMDEVHEQQDPDLIEALDTGMAARRNPLRVYMTTADYARESPCNDMLHYARRVRDGAVPDPSYLPVIYETIAPTDNADGDDWEDPSVWARVNPGYPISPKPDYLAQQFAKAKAQPSFVNTFKRLHLNMQTSQAEQWLPMDRWHACPTTPPLASLTAARAFGGLDIAATRDFTAFALYWPEQNACHVHFWLPEAAIEAQGYDRWLDRSLITVTTGDITDYEKIKSDLQEYCKRYTIINIAYDTWNANQLALEMRDDFQAPMVEYGQSFKNMNEPARELELSIAAQQLAHPHHPVLDFMASNVAILENSTGAVRPVKPRNNRAAKIDGIVAIIMAKGVAMNPVDLRLQSIYSERGIFVL